MQRFLLVLFLLAVAVSGRANDGTYLTYGGTIYPTTETKISMDREVLCFTVRDQVAQVNIQFEFNNPESSERKLLVGFQAPTAVGDVSDSLSSINQLANFTIVQNGQILPYTLKFADCEDCPLQNLEQAEFGQNQASIYVYLFEITFKPGVNRVNHSYSFPASGSVSMAQFYRYILTTGSKWANQTIKDFELRIDMGQNKYFYVADIFGNDANWSILGTGKVTDERWNRNDIGSARMVRVLSGTLAISVKNFTPRHNLEFGIISESRFGLWPATLEPNPQLAPTSLGYLSLAGEHSKEELRLLRNTIFAQYGYSFQSADLKTYFSQFEWYMPDPNLKMAAIELTSKERAFVDEILKRESE